ncbi:hypothetical protein [Ferrimonas balearica]|uniref:hypothetical protein n=1 Tax=Ferrimonas balearica TaxID=44012 RepID=UPI001F47E800|nr:hypothetical protein [Ferrimonas balearica]MBY6093861.1 hypothetical protein [Ferrimonas balearica]
MIALVPQEQLDGQLSRVRNQFYRVMQKTGSAVDWEYVESLIRDGSAFLWLDADQPDIGFVILRPMLEPHTKKPYLEVVMAYHEGSDGLAIYEPHICDIAVSMGAHFIEFESRRKAFLRMSQRMGYEPHAIIYRKDIDHG